MPVAATLLISVAVLVVQIILVYHGISFFQANHEPVQVNEKSAVHHIRSKSKTPSTARENGSHISRQDSLERFFAEYAEIVEEASKVPLACGRPLLELWPENIKGYFEPVEPLVCPRDAWAYVKRPNVFRLDEDNTQDFANVTCRGKPLYPGKEMQGEWGEWSPITDGDKFETDFVLVNCTAISRATDEETVWAKVFASIVADEATLQRASIREMHDQAMGYNVLMLGFDSTSKLQFVRNMNKTNAHINDMGAIVLENYNVVGEGTLSNVLPMMANYMKDEFKPLRGPMDLYPHLWKDFADAGYVTQFVEDAAWMSTFTYAEPDGFHYEQPTDHCFYTFDLRTAKLDELDFKRTECYFGEAYHQVFYEYIENFWETYPSRKFSFTINVSYSHDSPRDLQHLDDDIVELLKRLQEKGIMRDTIIILYGDHGSRSPGVRNTTQGKFEERNPLMTFIMPDDFPDRYPEAYANLLINANRLVTPFDIHATLHDVLSYSGPVLRNPLRRSISVFKEIPSERTCVDAGIDPIWCSCLDWKPVDSNDPEVNSAATRFVDYLNGLFKDYPECHPLQLANITKSVRTEADRTMLEYVHNGDPNPQQPDISAREYLLTLTTKPGNASFDVLFEHSGEGLTLNPNFLRNDQYGDTSWCIKEKDGPRAIVNSCYCKDQRSEPTSQK